MPRHNHSPMQVLVGVRARRWHPLTFTGIHRHSLLPTTVHWHSPAEAWPDLGRRRVHSVNGDPRLSPPPPKKLFHSKT